MSTGGGPLGWLGRVRADRAAGRAGGATGPGRHGGMVPTGPLGPHRHPIRHTPPGPTAHAITDPRSGGRPEIRATALRLARLHLRTGSLGLARAEFEALAGGGPLAADELVDLAEARWRTGDLAGAGEAAEVALSSGVTSPVALVIAAEAVAAVGRPGEGRRLAARALLQAVPLDPIFAGQPRSEIWPHDPGAPIEMVGPAPGAVRHDHLGRPGRAVGTDAERAGHAIDDGPDGLPDPQAELEAAREAILAGDEMGGGIRLAVILRLAPSLAPAVLDATGGHHGAAIDLVRGDAYRIVGHETEARRAYAAAIRDAAIREEDAPRYHAAPQTPTDGPADGETGPDPEGPGPSDDIPIETS